MRPADDEPVEVFADIRDPRRALRVTWHPREQILVLSVWRDDMCVATSQVDVRDLPRLSTLIDDALAESMVPAPRG